MIKVEIFCPDDFTEKQIDFIKRSAFNQIASTIRSKLFTPKEQIDIVEAEIAVVKEACGIVDPIEAVEEPKPIEE